MAIQKRIDEKMRAGQPIQVYSAFERGPTGPQSGFLYVEADSKQAVVELIEGIQNVFMGSGQFSIPPKERPDLLRKKKRAPLEVGKFVRMLRPTMPTPHKTTSVSAVSLVDIPSVHPPNSSTKPKRRSDT